MAAWLPSRAPLSTAALHCSHVKQTNAPEPKEPQPFTWLWSDLLELHVVRKLREIVRRRFATDVGLASSDGKLVTGGVELSACVGPALAAVAAGQTTFQCDAHRRLEVVSPVVIRGQPAGCAFAGTDKGQEDLLAELVELCAIEMAVFSDDSARKEGRAREGERHYEGIVGRSRTMQELYRLLDKVVGSDSTVLITGENGTGKELIARALHYNSPRAHMRFVVQNCSAFNDNLLDSELFGHKRGAFTGAVVDKQGLFELADRGTFFLDEIGDMSPALQVKVLRVLQEGTFTPVGGTETRKVDVRIIAATNRDLRRMVETGEFREDLYYRINVISIVAPSLRDRRDDIPVLVDYFLKRIAAGRRLKMKRLSQGCLDRLFEYGWPGNVRELENEIERLVVLAGDDKLIGEELLSPRMRPPSNRVGGESAPEESLTAAREGLERSLIFEVLQRTQWNKTRAAKELQMSRRNLIRKVQKYKLTE